MPFGNRPPTLEHVQRERLFLAGAEVGVLWVETSRVGRGRYVTELFTRLGARLPFRTWCSSSYEAAMERHDLVLAEAST